MDKPLNLHEWSTFVSGAQQMLLVMQQNEVLLCNETRNRAKDKIYSDAEYRLALSSLDNTYMYLMNPKKIGYRGHVIDKKGKLVSVEAFFIR